MHVDVEQIDTCVRRLTVEVPADKVNPELEVIYRNLQKRVKLPGFRPKKVPRRILENHYRHAAEQEVFQKLVPNALSEALTQESLRSVSEPQIDQMEVTKDQLLRVVATVQIVPDFVIGDYQAWQLERRIAEVTETDVDDGLEQMRERHATLEAVTGRPVQAGDFVIIDYQGFSDGRPVPGLGGANVSLEVGAGMMLAEIDRGLVGLEQGAEKTIPVHFPDNHRQANLAGQTVQVRVQIVEIKEKILPELDDEFARADAEADSLAALGVRVRQELEAAARQQADQVLRDEIFDRLVAENPIEVPDILVQDQMRRFYLRHKQQEMGRELTEAESQVEVESLRETLAEPALKAVRGQVLLHRLGEDAGITVSADEVQAEVVAMAARTAQNPGALKQAMERNGALEALESGLRERKIFEAIMADMHIADKRVQVEATVPGA
ncbi:Trigger factor [Candidatus Entotheonellaceae bacterium PAL068K]